MSSSGVGMNAELQEAKDFEEFFLEFQEKKQINWTDYEERMRTFLDRHYDRPGCKERLQQYDNSFAYISPDIVHDVIALIDEPTELQNLLAVRETWGEKARKKRDYFETAEFRWGSTIFDHETGYRKLTPALRWYDHHFKTLLAKASKLHGKLHLEELCAVSLNWFGETYSLEDFYELLNPVFYDVTLHHHDGADHDELVEPLRGFLVKQIRSSTLRRLNFRFHQSALLDQTLETMLLDFCLSDRFESLIWNCGTLSPEFFVQIYNAFKTKSCPPDCKTRQIEAIFELADPESLESDFDSKLPSYLQQIQQALSLERTGELVLQREESAVASQDRSVAIFIVSYSDCWPKISIFIELRHNEVEPYEISSNVIECRLSDARIETYVILGNLYYSTNGCCGECEIEKTVYNRKWEQDDVWKAEDCADCPGCFRCLPSAFYYNNTNRGEWQRVIDDYD